MSGVPHIPKSIHNVSGIHGSGTGHENHSDAEEINVRVYGGRQGVGTVTDDVCRFRRVSELPGLCGVRKEWSYGVRNGDYDGFGGRTHHPLSIGY